MTIKKGILVYLLSLSFSLTYAQSNPILSDLDSLVTESQEQEFVKDTLPFKNDESILSNLKFKSKYKPTYLKDERFHYDESENQSFSSRIQKLKTALKNWLLEYLIPNSQDLKTFSILSKIGFWILIGLVLFYIIKAILRKDIKWLFTIPKKTLPVPYDHFEQDIEKTDFEKLIVEATQNQEYRNAVRYYYLWLLQMLSKQGHIKWELEKTNADYTIEIQDNLLKKEFKYLSYLYNNIWYGEFLIDLDAFRHAQSAFQRTLKNLKQ